GGCEAGVLGRGRGSPASHHAEPGRHLDPSAVPQGGPGDDLGGVPDRRDGQSQPGPDHHADPRRGLRGPDRGGRVHRVVQRPQPGAPAPRPLRWASRRPAITDRAGRHQGPQPVQLTAGLRPRLRLTPQAQPKLLPMSTPAERYAASRERQSDPELAAFRGLYDFDFDDFQVQACGALGTGHGVLVAAPTGSGKTVVGEFAVHLALAQGRKCFYTTPIKALSNQKYNDLVSRYSADTVGLLPGDNSTTGEAPG